MMEDLSNKSNQFYFLFKKSAFLYKTVIRTDEYGHERRVVDATPMGEMHVMITPVTDEAAYETYGSDVYTMRQFILYDDSVDIQPFDRIQYEDDWSVWYEVVEVQVWNSHRVVRIRKVR